MTANLIKRWQVTWKPDVFQGWGKRKNYFEGWYFKIVSADESRAIALIPGISFGSENAHSFIQVMDGTRSESTYYRFEATDFKPESSQFYVAIEKNEFSDRGLRIDLPDIQGVISFLNTTKWSGTWISPGIMGWYSFVPLMQCYHGLVSINHHVEGSLLIKNQQVDFSGGKGYIEKDWGSSFPKSWIWTQCNNFASNSTISVMGSVAHIPWRGTYFIGFLALIWDGQKTKIFTTYTGAKMKARLGNDKVFLNFKDKEEELSIEATMAPGVELVSPIVGEMVGKVNESLGAEHQIRYSRKNQATIELAGSSAGLEVAGDTTLLLTDHWRK